MCIKRRLWIAIGFCLSIMLLGCGDDTPDAPQSTEDSMAMMSEGDGKEAMDSDGQADGASDDDAQSKEASLRWSKTTVPGCVVTVDAMGLLDGVDERPATGCRPCLSAEDKECDIELPPARLK